MTDDADKVKKHLTMVLDRISKGAKLIRSAAPTKGGNGKGAADIDDSEIEDA